MKKENLNNNKQDLRKHFLSIRKEIPLSRKKEASDHACHFLKHFLEKDCFVLSFAPIREEIDIGPLNQILSQEKKLLLPKLQDKDLKIFLVSDIREDLKENSKLKILEPVEEKCLVCDLEKISCVLVPGLAFDLNNHRLGYGWGCYDRFLKKLSSHTKKIGLGFKEQLSSKPLPTDFHDQPLDHIYLF